MMKTKSIVRLVKMISLALAVALCVLGLSISLAHDANRPDVPDDPMTDLTETSGKIPEQTTSPGTISHNNGGDPGKEYIDYLSASGGKLELPVSGASGYASITTGIRESENTDSKVIGSLKAGDCFRIISESGALWHITTGEVSGWIPHKYCFINLPDVIPSIIYNATNARASIFASSGKDIPGITGEKLFDAFFYNERLGKDEFAMPVLYSMAPKICAAQQAALSGGNTLVIYETFRPAATQKSVVNLLGLLVSIDPVVSAGVSTAPWSMNWFISTGVSNHQRGYAMDVTLAKVRESATAFIGDYMYIEVTAFDELTMPTAMHELSRAAACLVRPVSSSSKTAWKRVATASSMNDQALLLQKICTDAGMTPLASEWWHFNDLDTAGAVKDSKNVGNFFISAVMSSSPEDGDK